jgi:16S rRNA (guanine527-N7)-methyltransferase
MTARNIQTPQMIGRHTRVRVGASLEQIGFVPDPPFPRMIELFAATLALWGGRTNLTAAPDDPEEIAFHIVDSLMALPIIAKYPALQGLFAKDQKVLDLGSGAGFPGLILAAASDAAFVLLENRRKRAHFLEVAAATMGLANVRVATSQTSLQTSESFDLVMARAFAKPAEFYRSAVTMLRQPGKALLYATPNQPLDEAAAAEAGFGRVERLPYVVRRGDNSVSRLLVLWNRI